MVSGPFQAAGGPYLTTWADALDHSFWFQVSDPADDKLLHVVEAPSRSEWKEGLWHWDFLVNDIPVTLGGFLCARQTKLRTLNFFTRFAVLLLPHLSRP